MRKKEARIARENERRMREQEKSARLRERNPESGVRIETAPSERNIRLGANPGAIFTQRMTWTCDAPDREGNWSWGVARAWSDEDWKNTILPKLEEWRNLTWGEIDRQASGSGHKMHHNMQVEAICEEAQLRLIEIERFADVVFRFRLGNLPRLWGFRTLAEFEVLWFDPTHKIYPIDPR